MSASQRSPNVLSVGDAVWCSLWTDGSRAYPFLVRVRGFTRRWVDVEAVDRSDDPMVDNEWQVPYGHLRRST